MSESKITKKDVERLKNLARVEFGEKETEALAGDLEGILNYVETLKEVDIEGVSEVTHAADLKNVFRKDEDLREFDAELASKIISAFPEKEKTYLRVKAVLKK